MNGGEWGDLGARAAGPGPRGGTAGGRAPGSALKVLVTGGSGFLGAFVLREAARRGHETVALARSEAAAAAVTALGAKPLTGDLNDTLSLADTFARAGCDTLLNLASLGFGHAPAIIAAAERAGISRAAFVSTTATTTTHPAESKLVLVATEHQIRVSALDRTVRPAASAYADPGRQ